MNEDQLRDEVAQLKLLLKQEEGKRIAVERENAEVKRQAKQAEELSAALQAETAATLAEAADQMKVALAVSQGIWSFAHMGRAFLARKVAAARVVHRESQICLLIERIISNIGKDPAALQAAVDQARHVIETIRKDGEATRMQVSEACFSTGLEEFTRVYDQIVAKDNQIHA